MLATPVVQASMVETQVGLQSWNRMPSVKTLLLTLADWAKSIQDNLEDNVLYLISWL